MISGRVMPPGRSGSAACTLRMYGLIPASRSFGPTASGNAAEIEEERRLLYVAMTRARRHLNLLAPQRFHVTQQARWGDRHLYAGLSRFLSPAVQACFDLEGGGTVAEAAQPLALV